MNGYKVGFGSPAAMEKLGIDRPLIAPISDATLLEDGASVDVTEWKNPAIELEVAVHAGRGLSVAIELVDVDPPPTDPEAILAAGIFHRHVILGPVLADATPGRGTLDCNGERVATAEDPAELTGGYAAVKEIVEGIIGRPLANGEVVITGSVVPPQPCAAGQRWEVGIEGLGALAVHLTAR
jgi:2-keto-4-pentenoate hydratase